MMETLSNMLDEANNIATFDMEPLSMEGRNAAADLHMLHKAKMQQGLGGGVESSLSSTTKTTTTSWKKDADKPKRPLSAYNLFFQHEREKIITSNPDASFEETMHKIRNTPRPKKRRHRKSHGKIGFAELARTIAEKWKGLEAGERHIFESKAAEEKAKYKEELEQWTKDREERAKLEEQKSPLERARVEVVYDDYNHESKVQNNLYRQAAQSRIQNPQESLSSLVMQQNNGGAGRGPGPTVGDVRDYLQMTQQTIEMARATLSLPLFANIGGQVGNGMMGQSMMGGMAAASALEQSQNVGMSAQDLLGMASNANGNMGFGGGALAGAFGGNNHNDLSNQDVYNQLMSSAGSGSNPLVDLHNSHY